jgi:putative component of membrane protein insertase Oxa1/YidC/SpoIIIJ protein YidD
MAILEYGSMKGSALALRRVLKCHPWHTGGVDLVPDTKTGSAETLHEKV